MVDIIQSLYNIYRQIIYITYTYIMYANTISDYISVYCTVLMEIYEKSLT